jgi:hypothetical protein
MTSPSHVQFNDLGFITILHTNQYSWDVPTHTKMENYSLLINMS